MWWLILSYGEIQGANTISASTITATTLNANVVADTIHGEIQGANTISASTITATTLNANVVADTIHGEIQGANTISASTITATTLNANVVADTIHGEIQGANNISASTITATTLNANVVADTIHGEIQGANAISASTITATTIVSNVVGNIQGANTISASFISVSNIDANTVNANIYFGDGGLLSNIAATLQDVTVNGNTTTQIVQFTNTHTAFTTSVNANVGVNIGQLNDVVISTALDNQILSYTDGTGWVNDYLDHTVIRVKNTNVSSMSKGAVICAADSNDGNDTMNVHLSNAAVPARMPALGVLTQALDVNESGTAVSYGRADGVNTSGFLEGETLYVSNTVPGGISNVKPYGPTDGIQNIGICVKSHQNGIVFVTGIGRTNDIPNAPLSSSPNYVYVNETKNDLKKIAPGNLLTKLQTLEQVVNTGNTVANTIQVTGLTTTGNVTVGGNTFVPTLSDPNNQYLPMVNTSGKLVKSPVYVDSVSGRYVITSAEAEFLGNITLGGNTTILSTSSLVVEDRIIGIGANNYVNGYDMGLIMEHLDAPGDYSNLAIIYHSDEHVLRFGYTKNSWEDNHITSYFNPEHPMKVSIEGNLSVQNNLSVVNGSYFGDGTKLLGVALSSDLTSNASRISNLETSNGLVWSNITEIQGDIIKPRDF
jgi:hypothetical protein